MRLLIAIINKTLVQANESSCKIDPNLLKIVSCSKGDLSGLFLLRLIKMSWAESSSMAVKV